MWVSLGSLRELKTQTLCTGIHHPPLREGTDNSQIHPHSLCGHQQSHLLEHIPRAMVNKRASIKIY